MKKWIKKGIEQYNEDVDIYDQNCLIMAEEEDILSGSEAGFMAGYLS
jgi:hypothetical protein